MGDTIHHRQAMGVGLMAPDRKTHGLRLASHTMVRFNVSACRDGQAVSKHQAEGIGVASVFVSALIGLYYNVIVAYCLVYMISSMTSELPWSDCNNDWNSDVCISNSTGEENTTFYTPSEEYFYKKVLDISDGIDDPGGMQPVLVGSLAAAWFIVFLVLIKGVGSLGK
ncbi:PREDICTED: sodium-dependent proline transporter-like, partial [Priapulus caudatus]|uniref:Sodium-dependent proline transporter-like n=1 Tax=Priapulus caudatus TaxID=37621 RepID=A0ABM1F3J0_PRICU